MTRLDQTKALLQSDLSNMDQGLVKRLSAMDSSFDDTGKLIEASIDESGNILRRSINDQGELLLNTYSRMNGQLLDAQSLSINRLMNEVADNRIVQGSNASMQGASPTAGAPMPESPYSGLASPYAQTIA